MSNLFETTRKAWGYLLILSFTGWIHASTFQAFAQGQYPDARSRKSVEANADGTGGNSTTCETENPEKAIRFVEQAEVAKPKIKKKFFPWLGVILSLALAGGLIYYLFIVKNTLQVNTTPAGARVYLDGKDSGKISPCQLKPSLGAHTIKVVLEGYADGEREIVIKNGKNSVDFLLDIGTFAVNEPEANANVQRETQCVVRWDSSAMEAAHGSSAPHQIMAVTKVDLMLFQNDIKISDVALAMPNSGSYTWNVPAATNEGHNFKIQISCSAWPDARAMSPAFNLLGFKEDFTDNTADFWLTDQTGAWNAAGGYYSASQTSDKLAVSIYNFFYGESSYTVESRMRWSEHSGSNSGAPLFIMLGISNSFTNNSGYALGFSMDGMISVYRVENYNLQDPSPTSPTLLYSDTSSAVNQGINSWNTLKVVRHGGSYALAINDSLVYTLLDGTYNPTHVMLGFGGAGVKTSCDFDYVYMTVDPEN